MSSKRLQGALAAPPLVFISYSHADKRWLHKLLPYLKQFELSDELQAWADTSLPTGSSWYEELGERMRNARAAVLLVTQNFLASDFCIREEIPVLLQESRRGRLALFPVLLDHCNYAAERWLKRLQMKTWEGGAPILSAGNRYTKAFTELAKEIARVVKPDYEPPGATTVERWLAPGFDMSRLPETGSLLFGRKRELGLLDQAWEDPNTHVVTLIASGGTGKTTLARVFCETLAEEHWRGAERAFAWSFCNEGSGRMSSSEDFLEKAFDFFGERIPAAKVPDEQGQYLAELINRRKTLLVLDGVESLQSDFPVDRGRVRDPAVRALLEALAEKNSGLCLVTTREPLSDFQEFTRRRTWTNEPPRMIEQNLNHVDVLAGRALLRVKGVRGEDRDFETRVRNLDGNALAITLLGSAIAETSNRHIGSIDLPAAIPENSPACVMQIWADRLGDSAELEVLHLLGLIDRPAPLPVLQAAINGGPLAGLSCHLVTADIELVVSRLRGAGLVMSATGRDGIVLDTHPLVREHFGTRLRRIHPESFAEAHRRLFAFYEAAAPFRPNTVQGMEPLFAAVFHGCAAGLYQEALDDIYFERINRGGEMFLTRTLHADAAALSCLSHFFAQPWSVPVSDLDETDHGWLLSQAGEHLQSIGLLHEAVEPMKDGVRRSVEDRNWRNAVRGGTNLSLLLMAIGDLEQAVNVAKQAVEHSRREEIHEERIVAVATLAEVLFRYGHLKSARFLFKEAERLLSEVAPDQNSLVGYLGYRCCQLWLALNKPREALKRAKKAVAHDTAFDFLSLGCVEFALDPANPRTEALVEKAVDRLRKEGSPRALVEALLIRAEVWRGRREFALANRDLDEVGKINRRSGLVLFSADMYFGRALVLEAKGDLNNARTYFKLADLYARAQGYGLLASRIERVKVAFLGDGDEEEEDDAEE